MKTAAEYAAIAKVFNDQAEEAQRAEAQRQIQPLRVLVEETAAVGKYSANYTGPLGPVAHTMLMMLGFVVQPTNRSPDYRTSGPPNPDQWLVSWDQKQKAT